VHDDAAGLHESPRRPASSDQRADVDGGEGTVGVLAPGDRNAQGLEGYRYTADLSNESGARSGPARRNLRDLPRGSAFESVPRRINGRRSLPPRGNLSASIGYRFASLWHRSAIARVVSHRRERDLHIGSARGARREDARFPWKEVGWRKCEARRLPERARRCRCICR